MVGEFSLAMHKSYLHLGLYHSLYEWFNPLFKEDVDNLFQTNVFPATKVSKYTFTKASQQTFFEGGDLSNSNSQAGYSRTV